MMLIIVDEFVEASGDQFIKPDAFGDERSKGPDLSAAHEFDRGRVVTGVADSPSQIDLFEHKLRHIDFSLVAPDGDVDDHRSRANCVEQHVEDDWYR